MWKNLTISRRKFLTITSGLWTGLLVPRSIVNFSLDGSGEKDAEKEHTFDRIVNEDMRLKIRVVGIGGAGGQIVNHMIDNNLQGVEFIGTNIHDRYLQLSKAPVKYLLEKNFTKGLGVARDPHIKRDAMSESVKAIRHTLKDSDLVFITGGLGGKTGSGYSLLIADICRELGILTVAVVSMPFLFEGEKRKRQAEDGFEKLRNTADSVIVVPNQQLLSIWNNDMPISNTLNKSDEMLFHAVKGISDLLVIPGLIGIDFADVKNIMSEMKLAHIGTGIMGGKCRAVRSAQKAISSPLMKENTIRDARGVLVNITGGSSMTFDEVTAVLSFIQGEVHQDTDIVFGVIADNSLKNNVRVTVIAGGNG